MPGILYHTKTHDKDIKKYLSNPAVGRELVRKILLAKKNNDSFVTIKYDGKEITFNVKELAFDIKE